MPLFETIDQIFTALFIWILGFFLLESIRRKFLLGFKVTHFLYIWHTMFCLIYAIYAQTHTADANVYYLRALTEDVNWGFGTKFIVSFSSLFIQGFHLSTFGIYLLFNIIGTLGLVAFYGSLRDCVQNKSIFVQRLALITMFLPSIHFWSAGLGKEPFAIMATGLALWSVLNIKRRVWLLVFAILIMGMVRPHIAGMFIIALSVAFIADKNIAIAPRIALLVLSLFVAAIAIPFVIEFTGLENVNRSLEFIEERQSYNRQGGGGIDISNMSLPMQLFTYIFRPLPFEAKSIAAFLASIDNIFLLFLFCLFTFGLFKKNIRKTPSHNKYNLPFLFTFIALTWLILAITTANLGIAVRQKWMFLPFLIFIFFLYMPNYNFSKKRKYFDIIF